MREITIGEKTIRVRATPLALLYYRQEFKSDLVSSLINFIVNLMGMAVSLAGKDADKITAEDIASLNTSKIDITTISAINIDMVTALQIVWAMAKADAYGHGQFPAFEGWLSELESFDMNDTGFLPAVLEEAASGFFPRGKGLQQPGKRRGSRKN